MFQNALPPLPCIIVMCSDTLWSFEWLVYHVLNRIVEKRVRQALWCWAFSVNYLSNVT